MKEGQVFWPCILSDRHHYIAGCKRYKSTEGFRAKRLELLGSDGNRVTQNCTVPGNGDFMNTHPHPDSR